MSISINVALFGNSSMTYVAAKTLLELGYTVTIFCSSDRLHLATLFKLDTLSCPFHTYTNITSPELFKTVASLQPDYLISAGLKDKIPDELIKIPNTLAFNIHPSKLPYYKGPNPWFWVIRHNEAESAVTLHILTSTWDAGDILYQHIFPLSPVETRASLDFKTNLQISKVLKHIHPSLISKQFTTSPQPTITHYQHRPTPEDLTINWTQNAKQIESLIRACNPGFTCKAKLKNLNITLREVEITPLKATIPGTAAIIDNELYISATDNLLKVMILEDPSTGLLSGKKAIQLLNLSSFL